MVRLVAPGGGRRRGPGSPVLLAALGLAVASGCSGGATAPATGGSGPTSAVRVATAPVGVRDVTYVVEAAGSLQADEEIQVVAGVEGVVTGVRFREGETVTPATVLATIDPERYATEAERARAIHERVEAQHRQALAELRRREELARHDPPLLSAEEVERSRLEEERLRASVAEARAARALAEQDRERSIVRPLVGGVINSKSVSTGQHVKSESVLATLVDVSRLRLRFRVSEQESARLREGMEMRFTIASVPGREFAARVFHVSAVADPGSRMVECLAWVENPGAVLRPGFFAVVRADVESRRGALVVPERAVLPTERGFVVYEVVDGKAVARPVELGLRTGDGEVEIVRGLRPGAVVVTDGVGVLRDGSPVEAGPAGA
jgi:RND family efflux transporter MFP subunit